MCLVLFRENHAVGLIFENDRSTWVSGEVSVSGDKLSYTPRPFAVADTTGPIVETKDPSLRGLSV